MGALTKIDSKKIEQALAEAKTVKDVFQLDFVQERFVANYHAATGKKDGENRFAQERFAYLEIIADKPDLLKVDNFYHMAAVVKAGTTGLSFRDNKLYVIPTGNGLKVQSSPAGKREQFEMMPDIKKAPEAILVMNGDKFTHDVANGRVIEHTRTEKSTVEIKLENIYASYQRLYYKDGEIVDVVVYHDDLVKAKSKSKIKSDKGLWDEWPGEACKKTATNRAFRLYHKYPDNVVIFGSDGDKEEEYTDAVVHTPSAKEKAREKETVDEESGEVTVVETVNDQPKDQKKGTVEPFI